MVKRKSHGRRKGSKGKSKRVQCVACGKVVPIDKAKKITRWVTVVDPFLAKELRNSGAYLPRRKKIEYLCISCSIYRGLNSPRQKSKRKEVKRKDDHRNN